MQRVKIVTYVPASHADAVRTALGKAGAGVIGKYSFCSFTTVGKGRYIPSADAKPFIGSANQLEEVAEERIEVVCDRTKAKAAIAMMKLAHPYEEVAFDISALINEEDL